MLQLLCLITTQYFSHTYFSCPVNGLCGGKIYEIDTGYDEQE